MATQGTMAENLNTLRTVSRKPRYYHSAYCCVPQCRSRLLPKSKQQSSSEKFSFHLFPNEKVTVSFDGRKNVNLRAEWKRRLRIGKSITKSMRVCSRHFKQTDFLLPGISTKASKLKKIAYPTLCIPQLSAGVKFDMKREKKRLSQNCVHSLPDNLCLKESKILGGGYEVWSLEDIDVGVRFGPYQGVCVDESMRHKIGGYQWRVERDGNEIMILSGANEEESNWLRYVNYAPSKQQQNLVAVQCHSEVYYVTCKPIPGNTELLVWYQNHISVNTKGCNRNGVVCFNQIPLDHRNYTRPHGEKPHELNVNRNTLPQRQNLLEHKRLLTCKKSHDCNICGKNFTGSSNLSVHKCIHSGEKPYECGACEKRFTQKYSLILHERIHLGEKPYKCNACGETFAQQTELATHERIHTDDKLEKTYECSIGEKYFVWQDHLKVHEKLHTAEKPYKCSVCGKCFTWLSNLIVHEMIHTGQKPYECNISEKRLSRQSSFRVHNTTHSDEKPYKCHICGKKFPCTSHLNVHKMSHTDEKSYICYVCGKQFTQKGSLVKHERRHTGEKPYECNTCGKHFAEHSCLVMHERVHTGEKPYKCNFCGQSFSRQWSLVRHGRIHLRNIMFVGQELLCQGI